MIDPLAVVIADLQQNAALTALVGGRIATQHHYGEADSPPGPYPAWARDDLALTLHLDGGTPDYYLPRQEVRLEARGYAPTQVAALQIYLALVAYCRTASRAVVSPGTAGGTGLLYWLLPDSGPSLVYDPDLGLHLLVVFLRASVGELALGGV